MDTSNALKMVLNVELPTGAGFPLWLCCMHNIIHMEITISGVLGFFAL